MSQYTHKLIIESDDIITTIKVHKDDSVQGCLVKYSYLVNHANTITCQEYPLKDNPVVYLKGNIPKEA